tara:strand:- start:617 stop:781 length:165 start_codon:yes stop_codon:yes gene_type:complete
MKADDELLALEICHFAMKTMPFDIKEDLDLSDQAFNDLFIAVHQTLNPETPPDP